MTDIFSPTSQDQVTECIRDHIVAEQSLDLRTGGSLISLGSKMDTDAILSLSNLNQVKLYEPEELVITLEPGVKLITLKNILAEQKQELRFEPPDLGPLLGTEKNIGTIGGTIGANLSGPKRFIAGAARDYVLGVEGVSGFGKVFKAGGRVVKNVTGYDVSKLMTGSYGTLGAITEMTLKLSPLAETETTIAVNDLSDSEAIILMAAIAGSPFEVSGLAHLPNKASYIRIEGTIASIKERTEAVLGIIGKKSTSLLDREQSQQIWQQIRDVEPLEPPRDIPLWRISAPVTEMAAIISAHNPEFYYFDWAGSQLWMSSDDFPQINNGAFWLIRNTSNSLPFMSKPGPITEKLQARVKNAFDPRNILNPGRMGL